MVVVNRRIGLWGRQLVVQDTKICLSGRQMVGLSGRQMVIMDTRIGLWGRRMVVLDAKIGLWGRRIVVLDSKIGLQGRWKYVLATKIGLSWSALTTVCWPEGYKTRTVPKRPEGLRRPDRIRPDSGRKRHCNGRQCGL